MKPVLVVLSSWINGVILKKKINDKNVGLWLQLYSLSFEMERAIILPKRNTLILCDFFMGKENRVDGSSRL